MSRPVSRLSSMAVASLALAVVPCCPPLNLAGSILGLVAHRRILAARGGLRGLGIARAAIFSGIALSLLATILWTRFAERYRGEFEQGMVTTVEQAVEAAIDGRPGEVQARWIQPAVEHPPLEQVEAFGVEVRQRYGALQRLAIVSETQSGILAPRVQAAVIFHFENGQLNGAIELDLVVDGLQISPTFRIRSLLIEDPENGDLRLPAPTDPD